MFDFSKYPNSIKEQIRQIAAECPGMRRRKIARQVHTRQELVASVLGKGKPGPRPGNRRTYPPSLIQQILDAAAADPRLTLRQLRNQFRIRESVVSAAIGHRKPGPRPGAPRPRERAPRTSDPARVAALLAHYPEWIKRKIRELAASDPNLHVKTIAKQLHVTPCLVSAVLGHRERTAEYRQARAEDARKRSRCAITGRFMSRAALLVLFLCIWIQARAQPPIHPGLIANWRMVSPNAVLRPGDARRRPGIPVQMVAGAWLCECDMLPVAGGRSMVCDFGEGIIPLVCNGGSCTTARYMRFVPWPTGVPPIYGLLGLPH